MLALQSSGFFATLDNGVFVGTRRRGDTIWGAGASFSSDSFPGHSGAFGFSIYPGAKFVWLRAADARLELIADVEVGVSKLYLTDRRDSAVSDGFAVWARGGPGVRFWLVPSLAISYSGLFSIVEHLGRTDYAPGERSGEYSGPGARPSHNLSTGLTGRLTLLGVF